MASLAVKVGASTASSTTPVSADQCNSPSQLANKFDVIVIPKVPCTLEFQVYKNRAFSDVPAKESIPGPQWTKKSELIKKITKLHVTIPASTGCYYIFFHTDKAFNKASFGYLHGPFHPFGVQVSEYTFNGITKNGINTFDPKEVKLTVKEEQNLMIEDVAVSAPAGAPALEVSDEKGKK